MSIIKVPGQGNQPRRNGGLRFRTLRGSSVFGRTAVSFSIGAVWVLTALTGFAQDELTTEDTADTDASVAEEAMAEEQAMAAEEAMAEEQAVVAEEAAAEAASEAKAEPELSTGAADEPTDGATENVAAAPEPEAQSSQGELDEIVVTVDRRRKNLQDYSGTASAFSEKMLTAVGVSSVQDLGQMVPGLQIGINNDGATVYIRGVGSDNTTELGDPAVAIHVDGVYLPRFRGMGTAFLDVERVEVNSGPQGTIRGRNAVGGSISVISKKPVLGEYQANAEATFGTFRQRAYQGMVNIPLGDSAALRVAASSTTIDATWPNNGPIDHIPGAQSVDDYAMKGSFRWEPTDRFDITLAGDYNLQRGTGWGNSNVIGLLQNRNDAGSEFNLSDDFYDPIDPNSIDNPRQVYRKGRSPSSRLEHWGLRLSMNYDTGPVNVELLASHRYQDWRLFGGSALGPFEEVSDISDQEWDDWSYSGQQNNDSASTVGELRFSSPDDQQLVWSFGLFGFYEDQGAALGQITGDRTGGFNEFNMPSTIGSSFAAYTDMTFHATEDLRIVAGLRYTIEHKDRLGGLWMLGSNLPQDGFDRCAEQNGDGECVGLGLSSQDIGRFGTEGFRYRLLDRTNYDVPDADASTEDRVNFFFDGIDSFGVRDQTAIALCNDPPSVSQVQADPSQPAVQIVQDRLTIENGNLRCAYGVRDAVPADITNPRPQNGRVNNKYADFRVGVEYDLAKDNMLYATLSSAHKAGGFNDSLPNPDSQGAFLTPDYNPETAYSAEIGSKNLLMDRKLRLNAAAFAYLYEGQQFQTIVSVGEAPPIGPDGTVLIDPDTNLPFVDNRSGSAARQNAENASTAYGLDVDATYALPFGLEADLHLLLMNARFPDNTYVNDGRLGLNNAPAEVDIGGNWIPRVSPFILNYHLSQMLYTSVGQFNWVIQGQTRGEHFMTAYNGDGTSFAPRGPGWGVGPTGDSAPIEADDPTTPEDESTNGGYNNIAQNLARLDDRVPMYTVVNLGVGWQHPDGRLSIRGFVNNVFNIAFANTIISDTNNIRSYNNPRMAGVRVRMDW